MYHATQNQHCMIVFASFFFPSVHAASSGLKYIVQLNCQAASDLCTAVDKSASDVDVYYKSFIYLNSNKDSNPRDH